MQDETNTQICQTKHYEVAGMLSLAELHWETMHYTKKIKFIVKLYKLYEDNIMHRIILHYARSHYRGMCVYIIYIIYIIIHYKNYCNSQHNDNYDLCHNYDEHRSFQQY